MQVKRTFEEDIDIEGVVYGEHSLVCGLIFEVEV